ncbi:hypothetical protein ACWGHD_19070 [Streptomyces xanthophaeus]
MSDVERTREERIEDYYQSSGARELAESLVDAEDRIAGLKAVRGAWWGLVHRSMGASNRAGKAAQRYRSAWLSARRRAADEYNHTAEALAERDAEIARLKLRESFYGGPALECMGTEEDGGTVYRLKESA